MSFNVDKCKVGRSNGNHQYTMNNKVLQSAKILKLLKRTNREGHLMIKGTALYKIRQYLEAIKHDTRYGNKKYDYFLCNEEMGNK